MKSTELRKRLEQQDFCFPDDVWEYLIEEGYVKAACQGDKREARALIKVAFQRLSDLHHSHPGRTEVMTSQEAVPYKQCDLSRILALSEYYAKLASDWPQVRHFREEVLGNSQTTTELIELMALAHHEMEETVRKRLEEDGLVACERLLSSKEAEAFLSSPATAILSLEQFREWAIPVIGHKAVKRRPHAKNNREDFSNHGEHLEVLTIDPPGDTFIVRARTASAKIVAYRLSVDEIGSQYPANLDLETVEDTKELSKTAPTERVIYREFTKEFRCLARASRGFETKVVWSGSILDELRQISINLAEIYHWDAADAVSFILTGKTPTVQALKMSITTTRGGDFNDAFLNIKVLPWVSTETVRNLYHNVHQRMLRGKGERSARSLEVCRFVTREAGIVPNDSQWKCLFEKWQSEHPNEDTPFKYPRDIKQCYSRVISSLLKHNYTEQR